MDFSDVNICFFGSSSFSVESLELLHKNNFNIKLVITQSPKRSGRGQSINNTPVFNWAKKKKIEVIAEKKPEDQMASVLQSLKLDFIVVVAFGQIISEKILNLPKFSSLNVHASLLPKWRGAAPIQRAILNGDKKTGVSIMQVVKELDAGPVILQKKIDINLTDTAGFIHDKLATLGSEALLESIKLILREKVLALPQNHSLSSYALKISKSESKINWADSAQKINNLIRAFNPWPGAWSNSLENQKIIRFKILDVDIVENVTDEVNLNVIGFCDNSLIVKCGNGFIKIKKLQKEGKKIMNRQEFLNGNKFKNIKFI